MPGVEPRTSYISKHFSKPIMYLSCPKVLYIRKWFSYLFFLKIFRHSESLDFSFLFALKGAFTLAPWRKSLVEEVYIKFKSVSLVVFKIFSETLVNLKKPLPLSNMTALKLRWRDYSFRWIFLFWLLLNTKTTKKIHLVGASRQVVHRSEASLSYVVRSCFTQ